MYKRQVFDRDTTNEDTPVTICVPVNDTDPDGNLDITTVTVTAQPSNGTVTSVDPLTGCITYTPDPNYNGPDTLVYQICDALGLCDTAIVYIEVLPVPDITATVTQTCNDNGTPSEPTDDYFMLNITVVNPAPGTSNQYQIYAGADLLATGIYGNNTLLEWRDSGNTLRFLADGVSTYTLTIRDADDALDQTIYTTTPVLGCSDCPPPTCPPVKLTKIPVASD